MMLTDLADVLRAGGLRVVEVPGWKTRSGDGDDFVAVKGILCHWTATNPAASGDYPTLNTILHGNGSTPGPLSQLGLGRDGTWYVIAAGVCWHAGTTDRVASDNYHAIGVEAEYHPNQGAWPEAQQRSYERGVAVLQRHYKVPLNEVRGHYEAAIPYGRKDDPKTLPGGMPGFRQRVAAVNLEDDVSAEEVWNYPLQMVHADGTTHWANAREALRHSELQHEVTRGEVKVLKAKVDALAGTLGDDEAKILAALKAMPSGGQVDVEDLAARLRGTLGDAVADELAQRLTGSAG